VSTTLAVVVMMPARATAAAIAIAAAWFWFWLWFWSWFDYFDKDSIAAIAVRAITRQFQSHHCHIFYTRRFATMF